MLEGSCDCGAVTWRFDVIPEAATACNCTICRRYGVLWAYDVIARSVFCGEAIPNTVGRLLRAGFRYATSRLLNHRPCNDVILLFTLFLLTSSCSTGTPQTTPQVVAVYSTSAAQPWLTDLYDCAAKQSNTVLSRVDDQSSADIALRVGEPKYLSTPAYKIDTEDILIVTHRQSLVQNLTLEEARALFVGQGAPSVQVWVYASGEDMQEVFDQMVMEGRPVASLARLAVTPQQMSDTLINEPDTIGILPQHWKTGDSRFVYTIPDISAIGYHPSLIEWSLRALFVKQSQCL